MSNLAIAITTAPRRKPTLHRALSSLRGAGFDEEVHLFVEPGPVAIPEDDRLRAHVNGSWRGCFGNWKHAARYVLSRTTAPWILVVQDDAVWLPSSADVLRAEMRLREGTRLGFLSAYVTSKDVDVEFVDGWNMYRGGWNFWGALALAMPRDAAEELLGHARFLHHRGRQAIDAVVAASMLELSRPSFVHVPSLVDHIGETSTIGHDDVAGNLHGHRFGERAGAHGRGRVEGDLLVYGEVRMLNLPYAAAMAREIFEEDCYSFAKIPPGSIVLDLGACYGEFAIRCAVEKGCHVVAFEPSIENRAVLESNRILNDLRDDQLTISSVAVGTPGRRRFLYRPEHPAGSRLASTDDGSSSYEVECVSLVEEIARAKARWGDLPLCVKMDCEGAEHEIFADPAWIDQVHVIAMEWHYYDGDYFRSLIAARGFSVHVEGGGPQPRPAWHPSIGGGLLFARRNKVDGE